MAAKQKNASEHKEVIAQGIHVVAKPIRPVCNLNGEHCFYLEKQALFGPDQLRDSRLIYKSEKLDPAGCHVGPGDDFNAGRQTLPLLCCRYHPSPLESEVLHALPQSGHGVVVHSSAEFDLDWQDTSPFGNQQIDFCAGLCSPEEDLRTDQLTSGERREFFNEKAFS